MKKVMLAALLAVMVVLVGTQVAPSADAPVTYTVSLPFVAKNRLTSACLVENDPMDYNFWSIITPDGVEYSLNSDEMNVAVADVGLFPPLQHITRTLPLQHGGLLDDILAQPRVVTITARYGGRCYREIHELAQVLVQACRFDRTGCPTDYAILRNEVGGVKRDLHVNLMDVVPAYSQDGMSHTAAIRLVSYDPFWLDPEEKSAALGTGTSFTVRTIIGKIGGAWDAMGPPHAAGTYVNVRALAEDNEFVYVGGEFANWNNIDNADGIVRYHKATGTWSALGTGVSGWEARVDALVVGPDGSLYVGGPFVNAGAVAANGIARWDGTNWFALGAGADPWEFVAALAIANDGTLYAGGDFDTMDGVPASNIARWDGANWFALGAGVDGGAMEMVNALAVGPDGNLYAGGLFTISGAVTLNHIGMWNPVTSVWSPLSTGTNGLTVQALAFGQNGLLYLGGDFTTAGGQSCNRVAMWNGTTFLPLGEGANDIVYSLYVGNDNMLYAGGIFTSMGGLTLADRAARWGDSTWSQLEVDLPGNAIVRAVLQSANGDLYLGFNTTGLATAASPNIVTYGGTAEGFPILRVTGPGTLQMIGNETTGQSIPCDLVLQAGEVVTFDFSPGAKSVTSSWGGSNRLSDVYPFSDLAIFSLVPDPRAPGGVNLISVLVTDQDPANPPVATITWHDRFWSLSDAIAD